MKRLLLMAAAVNRLGPETDLKVVNTAKVVLQVLKWTKPNWVEIRNRWFEADDECPDTEEIYAPLVRMMHLGLSADNYRAAERPGPALFAGSGNWGVPRDPDHPPCFPLYNSCRLTALGEQVAQALLAERPDLDTKPATRS